MKAISHRWRWVLAIFLTAAGPGWAATVSEPLGARLVQIQGGGATTLLGNAGFRGPTLASGVGSLSDDRTLHDPQAEWPDGAYSSGHYLLLENGDWSPILSHSGETLDLERPVTMTGPAGYRIIPLNTLDSLFGKKNAAGFLGGRHPGEADLLMLWDNLGQEMADVYYFNTEAQAWLDTGGQPAGSAVLYPDESLIVIGQETHPVVLCGWVHSGPASGDLAGGGSTTLLPNPFPLDLPIAGCGLESALEGGDSLVTADLLALFDQEAQAVLEIYYYNASDAAWRDAFEQPVGAGAVIPAGSAAVVLKHSAGSSRWRLPDPLQP